MKAPLDPGFASAYLWRSEYKRKAEASANARQCRIRLERDDGQTFDHELLLDADRPETAEANYYYLERTVKTLLWLRGGVRVKVSGADAEAQRLARDYSPVGPRAFDYKFFGGQIFDGTLQIEAVPELPPPGGDEPEFSVGGHWEGCRIGFDLGGSDRKVAAVKDGVVVFAEEVPWDPYFQTDPQYHIQGIEHSLQRAAEHLPRVDAIGGSSAGAYINNEVRVASLFRGIAPDDFADHIRPLFLRLQQKWGGVPMVVLNDGEVSALAGADALKVKGEGLFGISLGTSVAGGYVTPRGNLTTGLNEPAFIPIDYRPGTPADEWSGDVGCNVQYLSQQAVARLVKVAGIEVAAGLPQPKILLEVQRLMNERDARARKIYETIGVYLAHSLLTLSEYYDFKHVLLLGRVTTGPGGDLLVQIARDILSDMTGAAAPSLHLPDEKLKRLGQAVVAASLPAISR